MSRFFIDSNTELWHTIADELNVDVISMPYTLGDDDEEFYDLGRNTNFEKFFNRLKNGEDAKTHGLNVQNYIDHFEPVLQNGEDIVYVHFSGNMSGTFTQMQQAIDFLKQKYPERTIRTADTKSVSIGAGLLIYETAKMWQNGATDDQIIDFVENNRQKYSVTFLVDDLKHLKRGGRLSSATYIVGTMLNIKPILKISEDGVVVKSGIAKGIKRGLREFVDIIKTNGDDLANHTLFIAHACVPELADELKNLILAETPAVDVRIQPIGPTIGVHCGPGTIGFAYHCKNR